MTTPDCLRIRSSMDAIREMERPFALLFYGRLFELDPSARALFHIDLAEQGDKLMKTLHVLAKSLETLETVLPALREMGRRHAGYGVRLDQYDTVSEAFLWAFAQALGPNFDPPARAAWQIALDAVCDTMKAGAVAASPLASDPVPDPAR